MQAAQPAGYTRPGARAWKTVHGRSIGFASRLAGQHQGCRPRRLEPSAVADTAPACLSLSSRLTCAFFDHPRQGPKSVQNLLELGLDLLEGREFAVDIMHFHLEGHGRHSAVRAGLGDQMIALRWLPVGVFRIASLETGTDQTAGLIAESDILRAEAVNLQQAGISVWYQTPHGHAEKLTGRWLIDPIEQCRGAARAPLVPEVKGFIAAVGDKAEGDAHAGFSGDFMFGTRTETGQEIQRGRLQAGLFAAWFVVLHAELESVDAPVFPELGGKVEGTADRQGIGAIELYKVFLLEQIIGRKLGVFDQQFSKFGFQLGSVPALFLEVFDGFGNPQDIGADFADVLHLGP